MRRPFAFILALIVILAILAGYQASGQTIPPPVHLPVVRLDATLTHTSTPTTRPTRPLAPTATASATPTPTDTKTPTVTPTETPTLIPCAGTVDLQNMRAYTRPRRPDDVFVAGEIVNNTDCNTGGVDIYAAVRNSAGEFDEATVTAAFGGLYRDEVWPFSVPLDGPPFNWNTFEARIVARRNYDPDERLSTLYQFGAEAEFGTSIIFPADGEVFRVTGYVRNGGRATDTVIAYVTMYDTSGRVMNGSYSRDAHLVLDPNEQASYLVEIDDWAGWPGHGDYASFRVVLRAH